MSLSPDYCELDDLKRFLRVPGLYSGSLNTEEDIYDDIPLALAITSASRAIDLATNRQFGSLDTETAQYYTSRYDQARKKYVVEIDDVMTASGIAIEASASATSLTDYQLYPFNAEVKGEPWTMIIFGTTNSPTTTEGDTKITAKWGWTAVPDTIKNATLLQAARIIKRRDAPFGVAGSPDMGSEVRLLAKIDPDVAVIVRPYIRWYGGV